MDRHLYLDLARRGLRMPIGTDLVLQENPDPDVIRNHGPALGRAIEAAARRWDTPLAIPLMDLRLEKFDLLASVGVSHNDAEAFHFSAPLDADAVKRMCTEDIEQFCAGSTARNQALAYIASRPGLVPIGMAIGPFSLATRLMADPVAATALAGSGVPADDSHEVKLLQQCLHMAEAAVLRSVRAQAAYGARAIMICEPAACRAFLSPRQINAGSPIFEELVMKPNLRLRAAMDELGCDLIFHDCGELTDSMVELFAHRLHPVILSLGSSRILWDDARLVPPDVILYGNLPTRSFYSDAAMPLSQVIQRTEELIANMRGCGHPFILGSECDVLFVAEAEIAIRAKVEAMMHARPAADRVFAVETR